MALVDEQKTEKVPSRKSEVPDLISALEKSLVELKKAQGLNQRDRNKAEQKIQELVAALAEKSPSRDTRSSVLTGEEFPGPAEMTAVRIRNLERAFEHRRNVLRDTLGASDVMRILGTSRQAPHERVKNRSLLAIKDRGQLRFPAWQFDPNGEDGVIPGLPAVLRELTGSVGSLEKISWFTTPIQELQGRSPVEALAQRDIDSVIAEARAVHAS